MIIVNIVATILFLFWVAMRLQKEKALKISDRAGAEIAELCKRLLVVSSNRIPGHEIKRVLGHVTGTSRIESSCPEETDAAEKEAKLNLMKTAVSMGANAVIDIRMTSSSHQRQGSQWLVAKIYYTGTAVVI